MNGAFVDWVVEGDCPLCEVALLKHDGRGCCRCCGGNYIVYPHQLEIVKCSEHDRECEHWRRLLTAPLDS